MMLSLIRCTFHPCRSAYRWYLQGRRRTAQGSGQRRMLKITIGGAHWRSDRDVHVPGQRWPLPGMTSHTRTCTARQPRRHAVQLRHGIIKLLRCWIHKIRGFCKRADYGWAGYSHAHEVGGPERCLLTAGSRPHLSKLIMKIMCAPRIALYLSLTRRFCALGCRLNQHDLRPVGIPKPTVQSEE